MGELNSMNTLIGWGISAFVAVAAVVIVLLIQRLALPDEAVDPGKRTGSGNNLDDLMLNLSRPSFSRMRMITAIIAFAITSIAIHVIFGVVCGVVGYFLPLQLQRRAQLKRVGRLEQQLVDALELLANGLKSGLTLPQAMDLVVREFPAPISEEFATVLAETRVGVDFIDALYNLARRTGSHTIQILATGVAITKKCGGDLTEIFYNIANTIRGRSQIEGKLRAVTAQGRAQGIFLGLMPFGLIILLYFVDPTHVEVLFGDSVGIMAFMAVVAMVTVAQLWIKKLLMIDV
ncbi:MAG: type II secretion system F family protein [Deltaproteobacteria bacterium]|nr:type II secretion system F family protein [Deltaproteobacteria bacterium]